MRTLTSTASRARPATACGPATRLDASAADPCPSVTTPVIAPFPPPPSPIPLSPSPPLPNEPPTSPPHIFPVTDIGLSPSTSKWFSGVVAPLMEGIRSTWSGIPSWSTSFPSPLAPRSPIIPNSVASASAFSLATGSRFFAGASAFFSAGTILALVVVSVAYAAGGAGLGVATGPPAGRVGARAAAAAVAGGRTVMSLAYGSGRLSAGPRTP